jgi:uncharacterized protein YcnI
MAAGTLLAAAVAVLVAGPASAHVTVVADDVRQGAADAVVTLRVPNEEAAATTIVVSVRLPVRTPLASVRPAPKPGWTVSTARVTFDPPVSTDDGPITSGVGEVTWTATSPATGIPVGEFETFVLLVGPLPRAAKQLAFPTVQTYSDGKKVSWVQPTLAGGTEPPHPAPVLDLAATAPADATAVAPAVGAPPTGLRESPQVVTTSQLAAARSMAVVGLAVSAVALAVGAAALLRRGRR